MRISIDGTPVFERESICHHLYIRYKCLSNMVIIKKIEKKYYSKYNDFASQLYNICPLLGVAIIFGGIFYFWRTAAMECY